MGKYCFELNEVILMGYDLGLKTYPIFNEKYRQILNDKIKTHYFFREIGFKQPDKFIFFLNMKMSEIMPYYNQLYNSELKMLNINPFDTIFIESNEKATSTKNQDKNGSIDYGKNVDNNFTKNITGNTHTTDNSSDENKGTHTTTKKGTDTTKEKTTYNTTDKKIGIVKEQGDNTSSENQTYYDLPNASEIDGSLVLKSPTTYTNNTTSNQNNNTTGEETTNTKTGTDETDTTITHDTTDTAKIDDAISHESTKDSTENTTIKDVGKIQESGSDSTSEKTDTTENNEINKTTKGRYNDLPSNILQKWRDTFLNIDMQIITELSSLFLGVF